MEKNNYSEKKTNWLETTFMNFGKKKCGAQISLKKKQTD